MEAVPSDSNAEGREDALKCPAVAQKQATANSAAAVGRTARRSTGGSMPPICGGSSKERLLTNNLLALNLRLSPPGCSLQGQRA